MGNLLQTREGVTDRTRYFVRDSTVVPDSPPSARFDSSSLPSLRPIIFFSGRTQRGRRRGDTRWADGAVHLTTTPLPLTLPERSASTKKTTANTANAADPIGRWRNLRPRKFTPLLSLCAVFSVGGNERKEVGCNTCILLTTVAHVAHANRAGHYSVFSISEAVRRRVSRRESAGAVGTASTGSGSIGCIR